MKKNCLAFISSMSVVFFDSFYFITYLCLNEEEKNIPYSDFQRNLHFTLLFCSWLYICVCFNSESYTYWTLSLLLMDFVYPFWRSVVEENTGHNYSLCLLHLVSLCCSVSDTCNLFSNVGIRLYFFVVVLFSICSKRNSKYLYHTLKWGRWYSFCIFEIGVMV